MGGNPQTVRGTDDSLVMMVNDCTAQCTCMCVITYCEQITWESFEGKLTYWLLLTVLRLTWAPRTRTRLSHNAHKYFRKFLRPQLRTDLLHPIQFLSSGLLWFNEPQPQCVEICPCKIWTNDLHSQHIFTYLKIIRCPFWCNDSPTATMYINISGQILMQWSGTSKTLHCPGPSIGHLVAAARPWKQEVIEGQNIMHQGQKLD